MIDLLWLVWSLSVWVLGGSIFFAGIYLSYAIFKNSIDFLYSRTAFLVPTFFLFFIFEFFVVFPERLEWFYLFSVLVLVALALVQAFIAIFFVRRIWEFMGFVIRLLL
ncbi:MAG TPA: hypothetical protein VJK04_00855 [Candidatus Paceibacterota bacterium]